MKSLILFAVAVAAAGTAAAQSPAATETKTIGGNTLTIKYSSPRVKGREGKLFGKDGTIGQDTNYPVWRAGANAATAFHTDADLNLGGLNVPKGDYTLFVDLSDPAKWTLIVNKQTGQSGLDYTKSEDLGRVKMTMTKPKALVENLTYTIADEGGKKGKITLAWENLAGSVSFTTK